MILRCGAPLMTICVICSPRKSLDSQSSANVCRMYFIRHLYLYYNNHACIEYLYSFVVVATSRGVGDVKKRKVVILNVVILILYCTRRGGIASVSRRNK